MMYRRMEKWIGMKDPEAYGSGRVESHALIVDR